MCKDYEWKIVSLHILKVIPRVLVFGVLEGEEVTLESERMH